MGLGSLRFLFFAAAISSLAADFAPDDYLGYIKYLASPELKGRRTGTPELDRAAEFLASELHKWSVQPVNGSYFQKYEVTMKTALGRGDSTVLHFGAGERKLSEQTEFVPLNLSSNGTVTAPIVFAGYGITAPEYHYDDYAGIDVKEKIVLVLRHEPQENDSQSVFNGKQLTRHAEFESKIVNAKLHGAKAILIVNDAPNHRGSDAGLRKFEPVTGLEDYGILAEQITSPAGALLSSAGQSLAALVQTIDQNLKPHSFALPPGTTASIHVQIEQEKRSTRNVAGYLPGRSNEYVVVGAHYDHLGLGEQDSLAPSQIGRVHPGADDNASGTAGVLELARHFASQPKQKRGFLFLCFSGEEEGLLGSEYYVDHPLLPLRDAIAMINLDMIGRLRNNKVYVGGAGTAASFKALVQKASAHAGLVDDESEIGGYGASDHTSFTAKQIPTLFFFSGLHSDYHKPSDTWDKIDAPDAMRLLKEVAGIMNTLATEPARPQFVRVSATSHGGAPSSGGGYGPYFGSIPDFGSSGNGVRFSDVRDGSPAGKAGFKAGDVLVEFDGKAIANLYDFTYALRAHKPGDVVTVRVLRDGKPISAPVTLTKRE